MTKRILILTPFYLPEIGGAETFVAELVKEAKKWFHITVLSFQPFQKQARTYEECFYKRGSLKIYRMRWLIKQRGAWRGTSLKNVLSVIPQMTFMALYVLSRRKHDIVHAQGLLSGLVAVWMKKIFKVKAFVTLLALYEFKEKGWLFNRVARYIFNNCDIIFVEGDNGKKDIDGLVSGEKVKTFSHWVDQDLFKPPKERPNDRIRILFVGRPIPEKGRHIIEGAERLLNNNKYEFTYVENATQEELAKHYQRSHILVVPSLYAEGYVRVIAEGASCGCVVITSDRGSLPEMVRDFGLVFGSRSGDLKTFFALTNIFRYLNIWVDKSTDYAKNNFNKRNAEAFLNGYTNGR